MLVIVVFLVLFILLMLVEIDGWILIDGGFVNLILFDIFEVIGVFILVVDVIGSDFFGIDGVLCGMEIWIGFVFIIFYLLVVVKFVCV